MEGTSQDRERHGGMKIGGRMESSVAKTEVSNEEVPVNPAGDEARPVSTRFELYFAFHMANPFISLKPLLKCPLLSFPILLYLFFPFSLALITF